MYSPVIFYGIIILHDIPYLIAKKRNHPHADAIHVAGWVSLFTLHVMWPFLWIWATLYRPERGWGMQSADSSLIQLQARLPIWKRNWVRRRPLRRSNIDGFIDRSDLCGVRMVNI